MKSLKKIIQEGLRLSINKYIPVMNESLRIGINDDPYQYHPTTPEELRDIIEDRYKELGPGTANNPVDFNDIDVSRMNSFYDDKEQVGIFEGTNFEYIDVSDWDVSNVTNMHAVFWGCTHLKSIGDLSNWNVSNVEDMWHMFGNSPVTNIPDWYKE